MRQRIYLLIIVSVLLGFRFIDPVNVNAQSVDLKAMVGKYYFSVSGYIAPFASVVLSSNGVFMASTVADSQGNFSIEDVLINEGFSDFCFEAIDSKRAGESFTCLEIPPARGDVSREDIFLPPTIGASGRKLTPGSSIFASGYSMPNAQVVLNISKDIVLTADAADKSGFYKIEVKDLPQGKYSLFAAARYQEKDSEEPERGVEIESLSLKDQILQNLPRLLLILLIVLLIIILLIILTSKRARKKLHQLFGFKPSGKKKKGGGLHHDWFLP